MAASPGEPSDDERGRGRRRDSRRLRGGCGALGAQLTEGQIVPDERGLPAREPLPALDDDIDVARIDLHQARAAPAAFRGDERGPAATEHIHHDVALLRAVEQRVLHHVDILRGGMRRVLSAALAVEAADPRILLHIGPVAAVLAQLHPVQMRLRTRLEDEHEFMARSVEASLAPPPGFTQTQRLTWLRPASR